MKKKSLGFGYCPEDAKQHFLVVIPKTKKEYVHVFERFTWDDAEEQTSYIDVDYDKLKISISLDRWKLVQTSIEKEFNKSLKESGKLVGKFKKGQVPVERLLGKELLLLLWAIEECDIDDVPIAVKNWLGLSREERWWLFTMTNATTGYASDKGKGWRVALRFALAGNKPPITNDNPIRNRI